MFLKKSTLCDYSATQLILHYGILFKVYPLSPLLKRKDKICLPNSHFLLASFSMMVTASAAVITLPHHTLRKKEKIEIMSSHPQSMTSPDQLRKSIQSTNLQGTYNFDLTE